ncbi:metallophosphoesterase [Anaeromyxobacter sp. PSR-1]|uniref:metallophosphoesterase family protein n=1 Tax=unclassified Anaeromyxobacter TaxID=2620896 RepID=UPI0005E86ACC|nr:metallophosphoesterase [Anaeromyxobacter sp. PSR-1]GAO02409.1 calcineurin-like phosphoesterase [Anaeromyxobacter sp. PSR-1]
MSLWPHLLASVRSPLGAVAALAVLASGCLEYSPYALPENKGLNRKAVGALLATPPAEPLRVALLGDTQLAFDEAEDAVGLVNGLDGVSFAIQLGDFTDLGLLREYELMHDVFARLRVPWLVVLGNHDMLGGGDAIYDRMFGARNLVFTWGRTRFVLLDTNAREYGFPEDVPDLEWLDAQLAPDGAHDRAVVVAHVPPWHEDFNAALRQPYLDLLAARGVTDSFYAHVHRYGVREESGVRLWTADALTGRSILLLTLPAAGEPLVEQVSW